MSTFLANLLNTSNAVEAAAPTPVSRRGEGDKKKGGETRSARVRAVYAEVFKAPKTVSTASAEMDISHVGCLNQLYRYEKRGFVKRLDESVSAGNGARALLWVWISK